MWLARLGLVLFFGLPTLLPYASLLAAEVAKDCGKIKDEAERNECEVFFSQEALDRAKDQKAQTEADNADKRKACLTLVCGATDSVTSPKKKENPCKGAGSKIFNDAKLFCDPDDMKYPNPFLVRQAEMDGRQAHQDGDKACYFYRLAQANAQATEALGDKRKKIPDEQRQNIELANNAWSVDSRCASETIEDVAHSSSTLALFANKKTADSYCKNVLPPWCKRAGGEESVVNGNPVCMLAGAVIDRSCFTCTPTEKDCWAKKYAKLKRIRDSLLSVMSKGRGCLSGMSSEGSALLGKQFGPPQTQICCGPACTDNTFPVEPGATPEGATAFASGAPNGKGRINILEGAYAPTEDLSAILFHEYLHRIGACTNANHNAPNDPYQKAPSSGACTEGSHPSVIKGCISQGEKAPYDFELTTEGIEQAHAFYPGKPLVKCSITGFSSLTIDTSLNSKVSAVILGNLEPDDAPQLKAGRYCATDDQCHKNTPLSTRWPVIREAVDPVYGCAKACYGVPTGTVGGQTVDYRNVCRNGLAMKPFGSKEAICPGSK